MPETLQVLVLDLDHTLVHTAETEAERAQLQAASAPASPHNLLDLSPYDTSDRRSLSALLCIPRPSLVKFFRVIKNMYHVFYLTAGTQEYGCAVVNAMKAFLLKDGSLSDSEQRWINRAVTAR